MQKKNDTSYENQGFFHWIKTKQYFFLKKKIQIGRQKNISFSSSANSQYFFLKFYGLVLGILELIDATGIGVAQPI